MSLKAQNINKKIYKIFKINQNNPEISEIQTIREFTFKTRTKTNKLQKIYKKFQIIFKKMKKIAKMPKFNGKHKFGQNANGRSFRDLESHINCMFHVYVVASWAFVCLANKVGMKLNKMLNKFSYELKLNRIE